MHRQIVEIPITYKGVNSYELKVEDFPTKDAVCDHGPCKKTGKLSAVFSKGALERIGPSIGSQLQSNLILNPRADGGKIVYDKSNPIQVQAQVTIVEKDTKPEYDDIGSSNINIPLPNAVGRFTFPVLVTVITRGGDRIPSSRFIQYVHVEVTEEE